MIYALSVRQPWAWCLFHGKDIENRGWRLPDWIIGQPVAIHASSYQRKGLWDELTELQNLAVWDHLQRSGAAVPKYVVTAAILGVGRFTGCLPLEATGLWKEEDQYGFQWVPKLELAKPIPCKGTPFFFKLPADIEAQVRAQVGQ